MPVEIERKFLVLDDGWRGDISGQRYCQGYLARSDGVTVRVRRAGPRAYLTVKGEPNGIARPEFEYEVPVDDAEAMLGALNFVLRNALGGGVTRSPGARRPRQGPELAIWIWTSQMRTSRSDDLGRAVQQDGLSAVHTRHDMRDDFVTGRCGRNDPSRIINALVAAGHHCRLRGQGDWSHIGTDPETQHLMLGGELEGATISGSSGPCRGSGRFQAFHTSLLQGRLSSGAVPSREPAEGECVLVELAGQALCAIAQRGGAGALGLFP